MVSVSLTKKKIVGKDLKELKEQVMCVSGEEQYLGKERSVQNSYSECNPDAESNEGTKAGAGGGGE